MIEKHCFGKAFFFWSKEPATSRVYVRVVYEGPLLAVSSHWPGDTLSGW